MRLRFSNARLVFPPGDPSGSDTPRELLVGEGKILEIAECFGSSRNRDETVDCEGDYLAPGLIDLHCHGALGRDTMEADSRAWETILKFHASRGTTRMLLTTVAAPLSEMLRVLKCAGSYDGTVGALLEGIHLEGPYFSQLQRGAHRSGELREPSEQETLMLLQNSGTLRRMTLAPEVRGSLSLARVLLSRGIVVSAGHSNASPEEAAAGFRAGISTVTHLFNCMSSLLKRPDLPDGGLAEAALNSLGIGCEIIADGHHVDSALLEKVWRKKTWSSVFLVSDATAGAGLPEGSSFRLGGLACRVRQGAATTREGEGRRLAGSTIGMIDAVRHMVEQIGVPLDEAVAMASLVPARILGIAGETGSLAVGKSADLLRFSDDWKIRGVWIRGRKTG